MTRVNAVYGIDVFTKCFQRLVTARTKSVTTVVFVKIYSRTSDVCASLASLVDTVKVREPFPIIN